MGNLHLSPVVKSEALEPRMALEEIRDDIQQEALMETRERGPSSPMLTLSRFFPWLTEA
jgi:hypothetical protein